MQAWDGEQPRRAVSVSNERAERPRRGAAPAEIVGRVQPTSRVVLASLGENFSGSFLRRAGKHAARARRVPDTAANFLPVSGQGNASSRLWNPLCRAMDTPPVLACPMLPRRSGTLL